jgi:DNA repair exonuclease SbcCD ATPase subunit
VAIAEHLCFSFLMKRLLLLVTALFLPGCQPEESKSKSKSETESSTPPPPSREEQQAQSEKNARLLNEKFPLERGLQQLISGANLDSGDQLEALAASLRQAERDFRELRQNHPRLQKLNRELSLWQKNAMSASSGEWSDLATANAQAMKVRGEIRTISKSLPEFAALEQRIAHLQEEADEIRRTLATQTPEGKQIIDRIKAIEAEISAD